MLRLEDSVIVALQHAVAPVNIRWPLGPSDPGNRELGVYEIVAGGPFGVPGGTEPDQGPEAALGVKLEADPTEPGAEILEGVPIA